MTLPAGTPDVQVAGPTGGPPAPLPVAAQGPAVPYGSYLRQDLGGGLHVVTDGSFQMLFLATDSGVLAVDAPQTLAGSILPAIAEVTDAPVTHVVYSHHHADHIGAAGIYPQDAARYAHRDAAALLARLQDPNRPPPTVLVDDHLAVRIGGQLASLEYFGPNHSPGNLFVHFEQQRTLMLVDVVFPGWVPFAYLGQSSDIPGWVTAHDRILQYDFDHFVGGHLARVGTRQDVVVQREYVADLRSAVERASAGVDLQAVFSQVTDPMNKWALFHAYTEAVADAATADVVPRWTSRLGGADVYTKSNVVAMAEALRIDYGSLGAGG